MVEYATHGYLTIDCIFLMVSSTLSGLPLVTFPSQNRQPVMQKQVEQFGIDLNERCISSPLSSLA